MVSTREKANASLTKHLRLNVRAETETSISAITETPNCRVDQFWPKVEDDIGQTINVYLQPL